MKIIKKYFLRMDINIKKNKFSDEINWLYSYRLIEYETLLSIISSEDSDLNREYLLRVWLLALYSNLEWFFLEVLTCYLKYISWYKIEFYNKELQSLYIAYKTSLKLTKKQRWKELDIIDWVLKIPNIFELNISDSFFETIKNNESIDFTVKFIDTESNVNTKVLKKNLLKIWITEVKIVEIENLIKNLKFKNILNVNQDFLDDLLDDRNEIAHGSKIKVNYNDLKSYHENVLKIFDLLKVTLLKSYINLDFLNNNIK